MPESRRQLAFSSMKSKKKSKKKGKKGKKHSNEPQLTRQELAAIKREKTKARKKFISSLSLCFIAAIVLGGPAAVVDPKMAMAVGGGIPAMILSYQYPRQALWFFLIYMPFSGTVTYWLAGGNAIFQLAKDAFYIPALIALVQDCRKKKLPILIPKKALPTFFVLLALALMTLFFVNGMLQLAPECASLPDKGRGLVCRDQLPLAQGILGLKVLIGYVPLIFCAFYLIDTKEKLFRLTRLHLILAIICCGLCITQWSMLNSGICEGTRNATGVELFKATLEAKCLVGGALTFSPAQNQIRLPGTFVSPWHWGWFLIANSAITFITAFCDPSALWRIGGFAGMASVVFCALISGQRVATLLVPVVIVILLVLTGQIANLKRFLPIALALVIGGFVVMASNPELIQERIDSTVSRVEASPPQRFIAEQLEWALGRQKGFLGKGVGKATNSTRIFGRAALVETFHPKLLYEIGIPGTLAFMAFQWNLVFLSFKAKSKKFVKDQSLRSVGSSFWVFFLIISANVYWYPLDTDPVAVYYWFFAGVIFRLSDIDQQEQEKRKLLGEDEPQPKGKRKGRLKSGRKAKQT